MKIETLGDFRQITENLTDDFKIDLRVRRRLTNEEVKEKSEITWPYPYHTDYVTLEFDDIGYSDKDLCLGCEVSRSILNEEVTGE